MSSTTSHPVALQMTQYKRSRIEKTKIANTFVGVVGETAPVLFHIGFQYPVRSIITSYFHGSNFGKHKYENKTKTALWSENASSNGGASYRIKESIDFVKE